MASAAQNQLNARLAADPRVKAWIAATYPRGTRGAPEIPADVLRGFGYDIPNGYGVAVQGGTARAYDKFDKWDVIIPAAAAAGGAWGMAGAPGIAGAAGQSAAPAAAGVLPSSSYPVGALMGGPPAIASQGVSLGVPLGGLSAADAARRAADVAKKQGAGGGGGLIDSLTSPKSLAGLAGLITTLATRPGGPGGGGGSPDDVLKQYPQLAAMLDMSVNRAQRTDPLHQAITQLAMNRLPTNVQK